MAISVGQTTQQHGYLLTSHKKDPNSQVRSLEGTQEQGDYLKSINNKASLKLGQCKMASGYREAKLKKHCLFVCL